MYRLGQYVKVKIKDDANEYLAMIASVTESGIDIEITEDGKRRGEKYPSSEVEISEV